MFILSNFIIALGKIVNFVLNIYIYIIVFRALVSWVNPDPYNPVVQFLNRSTEPLLAKIRRIFRIEFWTIDISPIIAILIMWFLQLFIVNSLMDLAVRFK